MSADMELPPHRAYVWVWRLLIAATVLILVVAATGACWGYGSRCPLPMTVLPVDYANRIIAYWWLILIAGIGASNYYVGPVLILCNTRQPWWGRWAWAIVCCVIPFAYIAYWIDCVERSDAKLRLRATRFAAGAVAVWLFAFAIAALAWGIDTSWGRNAEIAAACIAIAPGSWFLFRALGGKRRTERTASA